MTSYGLSPPWRPNAPLLFVLSYYRQEIFKQAMASVFKEYGSFLDKSFGELDDYVHFLQELNHTNHVFTFLMTFKDGNEEYQALNGPDSLDLAEPLKIRLDLFFKQARAFMSQLWEMQHSLLDQSFSPDGTFLPDVYEQDLAGYESRLQHLLASRLQYTGLAPTDPLYVSFEEAGQDYFLATINVLRQQIQLKHDVTALSTSLLLMHQRLGVALSEAYREHAAVKSTITPTALPNNRVMFSNWIKQLKKTATLVDSFPREFLSSLVSNQVISSEIGGKWLDELRERGTHVMAGQKENLARSKNVM